MSAFHTCTTHEGPPPVVRESGRLTEVMVNAPCCRNAEKPNAAITHDCVTHMTLFAMLPWVYGIASAPVEVSPAEPEFIAAPVPDV